MNYEYAALVFYNYSFNKIKFMFIAQIQQQTRKTNGMEFQKLLHYLVHYSKGIYSTVVQLTLPFSTLIITCMKLNQITC